MSSASPPPPSPPSPGFVGLSGDTLRRAESLTNVFEFSSVNPQYGYAENLGDGRGITFGRAGFCTGTGDGLVVVEEYTKREPNNPLASYLPALQAIEASRQGESNGDVTGLDGFVAAVKSAASDQTFKDVQDWVLNVSYLVPSQKAAQFLGAK